MRQDRDPGSDAQVLVCVRWLEKAAREGGLGRAPEQDGAGEGPGAGAHLALVPGGARASAA